MRVWVLVHRRAPRSSKHYDCNIFVMTSAVVVVKKRNSDPEGERRKRREGRPEMVARGEGQGSIMVLGYLHMEEDGWEVQTCREVGES